MSHLTAIREDHDPFDLLRFAPTFVKLLSFVHWSSYHCPYCSRIFRRDYWSDNVKLGCGELTCRHCGFVFDDGSLEWPQLSRSLKRRFFFPPLIIGMGASLFLFVFITPFMLLSGGPSWAIELVLLLVPLLLGSLRLPRVFLSIRRYNASSSR